MQRQRKLFRSAFDCDFSRFRHRFCSLVVNCGGKRRTFVLRLATCCMSHSPTGQRRLGGRIFDKFAGFDSRMRWFSKQWIPSWVNAQPQQWPLAARRMEGWITQTVSQPITGLRKMSIANKMHFLKSVQRASAARPTRLE